MAEAYPVRVFQALLAVGASLTGTRPGWDGPYPNDLSVFEGNPPADSVMAVPALGFEEVGGTTAIEVSTGGQVSVRHQMDVSVVGYVEAKGDVGASTWRLRLWDDLMTALYANDQLGGLVSLMEIGPRGTDQGMAHPRAEFTQLLTIHFFETKTLEVTA